MSYSPEERGMALDSADHPGPLGHPSQEGNLVLTFFPKSGGAAAIIAAQGFNPGLGVLI